MDEKRIFLESIRSSLGFAELDARGVEQCPEIFAEEDDSELLDLIKYRTHVEKQALLKILEENSEQLKLGVHPVLSLEAAAVKIVDIITSTSPEYNDIKQIVQHDNNELKEMQLWKKLAGMGVQVHTAYVADNDVREKTIASYIGITMPEWVVAESATVVQLTREGQPRSTSLLPSVHIAVIRLKHILANLSELYALLRKEDPVSSFTLISGPSKTADIEAHMVHGAHGPKEMHLVVVDEQLVRESHFKGSGLFSSLSDM